MKINNSFWLIVLISSFCILVACFGCADSPDTSTKEKFAQFQDNLTVLGAQVTSLERKVGELQAVLDESKRKTPPVIPVIFRPDDSMNDDPFLGPKDAQVLVMAFSNYQCQPCRSFVSQSYAKLRSTYFPDTASGSVKFVLRDYPLTSNPRAVNAAEFAHCAGEQGLYWETHDALFTHPAEVDRGAFAEITKSIAKLDQTKLLQCTRSARYKKEIDADVAAGVALGIKGAPSFFIGHRESDGSYHGTYIRGAQPYDVLAAGIDALLEGNALLK